MHVWWYKVITIFWRNFKKGKIENIAPLKKASQILCIICFASPVSTQKNAAK